MSDAPAGSLTERYCEALGAHFAAPSEETLAAAYELGREQLSAGSSLIGLAAAHHEALRRLGAAAPGDDRLVSSAREFLAEALGVFEMASRGYREANITLSARNRELEEAKAALEASSQELEAFSYSVSHDLRAPLRSIEGFSRALEEDNAAQLDATGRAHLERVREAARRMAQLIDDLLRLARASRGELRQESVDLAPLVREVAGRLRAANPRRDVELTVPAQLTARGDRSLLAVVLENLLSNAWKFTAPRAKAHVEVGVQLPERVYFVRDDGAGFDMRWAQRLFGVFQRLHSQADFEGTGIGLATVQRIIRRHGGRIWAQGAVNEGATFYFTLGE